jgi:hypothetical protein
MFPRGAQADGQPDRRPALRRIEHVCRQTAQFTLREETSALLFL